MKRIIISELQKASAHRPPGYFEDVMGKGREEGGYLLIEEERYRELCQKYSAWKTPVREFGPGALLSILIQQITGKSSPGCALCSARAKQMNGWGWIGCWRERATITQWLVEEAAKLGYKTDRNKVLLLLTAAIGEKLSRRTI